METNFSDSNRISPNSQQIRDRLADAISADSPNATTFNNELVTRRRVLTSQSTLTSDLLTVAGWTWNPNNAVTDGSLIFEGSDISTFPSAFLQNQGQPLAQQTVGNILFSQPNDSVTLDSGGVRRSQIELTWGGQGLANGLGNDFVVYENGDIIAPEGYAVAVRPAGSETFTNFRYEFYDTFESQVPGNPDAGVLATAFDLSDFGIAPGQSIDAIRIINLQANDRINGAGEGFLNRNGTTPLDPSTGAPFAPTQLDPDITFVAGLQNLLPLSAFDFNAVGTGDFNDDGNADIIFRNTGTGQNFLWLMNGTELQSVAELPLFPDPNWDIGGTGDFNSDGQTDLAWHNQTTGETLAWLLNSTTLVQTAPLDPQPDLDYDLRGTGDFNSDGQTDLLWRNQVAGDNLILLQDGVTGFSYNYIYPENNVDWNIYGTGDFNGDKQVDILWRNQVTGENALWLMNGIYLAAPTIFIEEWSDLDWGIRGTGDFNSDGQTDILWQNEVTDNLIVWQMNGTQLDQISQISTIG